MPERIKQDLISMLRAIQDGGFRESNVTDYELDDLLMDIADALGIDPSKYRQDDTQNSGWIPDEQQAGYIA